jgi:transcriptional regulator of acetoin/glycerol metabolism
MVGQETFRKDLYFRVSACPIDLPALADKLDISERTL